MKISKSLNHTLFAPEAALYILGLISSLVILFWSLNLPLDILNKPLTVSGGDGYAALALIKSTVENGSYLENPFLSAPLGQEFYDYPIAENFQFFLIKILYIFCQKQIFLTANIYYILVFSLTTLTSIYVLRKLGISKSICLILGLLYSFLPYHFLRGLGHFFLSSYYGVPLGILVSIWLSENSIALNLKKGLLSSENRNLLLSSIFLIIIGSSGVYYAFFTFLVICFSFVYKLSLDRSIKKESLYILLVLLCSLSFSFLANILPNIIYVLAHGRNIEVANRPITDSEVYGLKIVHLIVPQYISRLGLFNSFSERYIHSLMPLQNENSFSSLGIILSIGFTLLLAKNLFKFKNLPNKFSNLLDYISSLNIYIVLFSTIGGLSSLFALTISPQIRAWNRISVFIAFLAVISISTLLQMICDKFYRLRISNIYFYALCVFIFYVGILDQTSTQFVFDYPKYRHDFYNDQKFISSIEASLKPGSMVFQLPYMEYPEPSYLPEKMSLYDHMRGYLYSQNLKWSYGSVKGREASKWQKMLEADPIEVLLKKLSLVNFDGIYIDRYGYKDNGSQIENQLTELLKVTSLQDDKKRLMFFDIRNFKESYIAKLGNKIDLCRQMAGVQVTHPTIVSNPGLYDLEKDTQGNWRWSNKTSEISIYNPDHEEKIINLRMQIATGYPSLSKLDIYTDDMSQKSGIEVSSTPIDYSIQLRIKPMDKVTVNFSSDAQQVEAPTDPRTMFFRLINFNLSTPEEEQCWYSN